MGNITRGIRLTSMLVDHFAMTFICGIAMGVCIALGVLSMHLLNTEATMNIIILILSPLAFSMYLNKDAVKGQSVAKRILKNQVIDIKTGEIASPIRCFIRNVTISIWIIEIPFVLINPQRRLGDLIAGTRVECLNTELKSKSKPIGYLVSFVLGGIYIALIFYIYLFMFRSYNENFYLS